MTGNNPKQPPEVLAHRAGIRPQMSSILPMASIQGENELTLGGEVDQAPGRNCVCGYTHPTRCAGP